MACAGPDDALQALSETARPHDEWVLPDPVETRQVVLSGRAAERSVRVGWELAMSEATPTGLADLAQGGIDSQTDPAR